MSDDLIKRGEYKNLCSTVLESKQPLSYLGKCSLGASLVGGEGSGILNIFFYLSENNGDICPGNGIINVNSSSISTSFNSGNGFKIL